MEDQGTKLTSKHENASLTKTPGELVVYLISSLEASGLATVYLRNYENLPHQVGNDVDLLS